MNERVSDVVERFGRLTSREQTDAYLEIEEIWKAPRQNCDPSTPEATPLRVK
jgi:hypothetical protein